MVKDLQKPSQGVTYVTVRKTTISPTKLSQSLVLQEAPCPKCWAVTLGTGGLEVNLAKLSSGVRSTFQSEPYVSGRTVMVVLAVAP